MNNHQQNSSPSASPSSSNQTTTVNIPNYQSQSQNQQKQEQQIPFTNHRRSQSLQSTSQTLLRPSCHSRSHSSTSDQNQNPNQSLHDILPTRGSLQIHRNNNHYPHQHRLSSASSSSAASCSSSSSLTSLRNHDQCQQQFTNIKFLPSSSLTHQTTSIRATLRTSPAIFIRPSPSPSSSSSPLPSLNMFLHANTHSLLSNSILTISLTITSSFASVLLSVSATQLTQLSLATFPILEFLTLSIITRFPIFNRIQPHRTYQQPRFTGWRLMLRFTLPAAVLSLLASWSKAEIAARVGCGTSQAFDVYALPIAVVALSRLPSIKQPSHELVATISIFTAAISLMFFAEPIYPSLILLGLFSAASQALYLNHLKTWLLSFPQLNPCNALAHSSPFALLFILIPAIANAVYQSMSHFGSLDLTPRFTVHTAFWLIMYVLARVTERLLELWVVYRFKSPLSVILVVPPRNLFSIGLAQVSRFYLGQLGSPQSIAFHSHPFSHTKLASSGSNRRRSSDYTDQDEDRMQEKSPDSLLDHQNHHLQEVDPNYHRRLSSTEREQQTDKEDYRSSSTPRFRKPFTERYHHHRSSRRSKKDHWQTLFRSIAFGPIIALLILKLVWQSQTGIPMTEIPSGTSRPAGSVDLVFSYYNEPLSRFFEAVDHVRRLSVLSLQNPRVIVYVKHPEVSLVNIANVINADEVIRLNNVGREGGTYLAHILKHYNSTLLKDSQGRIIRGGISSPEILERAEFGIERILSSPAVHGLADHTVFMQPEISWHWIAKPRMDLFDPNSTGFLSFGPYLVSVCGQDGLGNGNYERMRDIYTMFYNSFCPPTGQLASYAGQFVVSKKRILSKRYEQYSKMRELLEAPKDHWIHSEGGWLKWKGATDTGPATNPTGPQAPFLGHALERSWPVIFGCTNPDIAASCPDEINDKLNLGGINYEKSEILKPH
ncbi:hypothetical protein PSTT_04026 [Puccinia striiformis]|uniref:Uncharacterized protein n=1 Tax=Puccinia striiformis TaxID=27350 RepID=A0A2S4VU12_9BASI|nr:hypothetical protein PSTT_04026 [Puccinia striiformis]